MQSPYYSQRSFLYGMTFFDNEVPYYNSTRHHRHPAARDLPNHRQFDDGTEYKPDESVNDSGEVIRMDIPNILNMETYIEKRLKVIIYGIKEEDDKEFTLEIGKRYAIQYITETGLKTADGYLRFLSSSIPEGPCRYAGNYTDEAMQAFIGIDCSKKGVSDKRKIYLNTIRMITELEDDEDYTPPAVAGTINDLLNKILSRVNYLENCNCDCETIIEKLNSIKEDVSHIKENESTIFDLDRNGDGTVTDDELYFEDIG